MIVKILAGFGVVFILILLLLLVVWLDEKRREWFPEKIPPPDLSKLEQWEPEPKQIRQYAPVMSVVEGDAKWWIVEERFEQWYKDHYRFSEWAIFRRKIYHSPDSAKAAINSIPGYLLQRKSEFKIIPISFNKGE